MAQSVPMARKGYPEIKVRPETIAQKRRFATAARKAGQSLSRWLVGAGLDRLRRHELGGQP